MSRRIVFDTSTLVSAALRVSSVPHTALGHALRFDTVFASEIDIKRLRKRRVFLRLIQAEVRVVTVDSTVANAVRLKCRDPSDVIFLALAQTVQTNVIVSSDEDLLELHPWNGISILTPAEFMAQR